MHPELRKLLDLQAKDEALRELDEQFGQLAAEEGALDAALRTVEQGLVTAQRAAEETGRRRGDVDARVANYRKLQEQRRQQLDTVQKPKVTAALMAELDLTRSALAKEEGDLGRVDAEIAAAQSKVEGARGAIDALHAAQAGDRVALAERRRQLKNERGRVQQEREASAARLDGPLRVRYDRLRRRRAANVVVALRNATCGACHTAIPTSRRSQFQGGLLLEGCEACGVILYVAEAIG